MISKLMLLLLNKFISNKWPDMVKLGIVLSIAAAIGALLGTLTISLLGTLL